MFISDSHTHTVYSADVPNTRDATVADMCAEAYRRGLSYFAITDHFEPEHRPIFPFEKQYAEILEMRQRYGTSMYIAAGLEYGEPYLVPDLMDQTLNRIPFDVTLASTHYIQGMTGFLSYPYEDTSSADRIAMFENYLDAWDTLVHTDGFDVYTHPTYPLRYCLRKAIPFDISLWEDRLRAMFRHIAQKGCGLEYNTAPWRVPNQGIPDHTTETVLRWYKEEGGEILTMASDAHFKEHIAANHDVCVRVAREIGFRYIAVYKNRKPEFHKILSW